MDRELSAMQRALDSLSMDQQQLTAVGSDKLERVWHEQVQEARAQIQTSVTSHGGVVVQLCVNHDRLDSKTTQHTASSIESMSQECRPSFAGDTRAT